MIQHMFKDEEIKSYLISDDNKGLVIFEKTADELTTFDI